MIPAASERCVSGIKAFEGFRARPYQDIAGHWTIGYGETRGIDAATPAVTPCQAELALRADLAELRAELEHVVRVPLTQGQADALFSFAYNFGVPRLASSMLLGALNHGDYAYAATQFPLWVHADGKVEPGLVKRRAVEKAWFTECPASSSLPLAS